MKWLIRWILVDPQTQPTRARWHLVGYILAGLSGGIVAIELCGGGWQW